MGLFFKSCVFCLAGIKCNSFSVPTSLYWADLWNPGQEDCGDGPSCDGRIKDTLGQPITFDLHEVLGNMGQPRPDTRTFYFYFFPFLVIRT